jgi:hypothetical protein
MNTGTIHKIGRNRTPFIVPDGAVRMKEWLAAESTRQGTTMRGVDMQWRRGKHPHVKAVRTPGGRAEWVLVREMKESV